MKCLILAAGYATRMYPLTKDFPKPLLPVKEKAILEYLLEDLEENCNIKEYFIVTNHRFILQFEEWKESLSYKDKVVLFDDGSTENENRLGAVKDIEFVIKQAEIKDDLLILAGDNLLDFSLKVFVEEFCKTKHNMVMCHKEEIEKLRKTGVAELSDTGLILNMEEKPIVPKGTYAIPPFYIFTQKILPTIQEGINMGCPSDSPGGFLSWLCKREEVYAMKMPGKRYDIGSLESYETVCKGLEQF